MNERKYFLETKLSKLFMKTAVPGGIAMLVGSLYMIFDTLFVGKLVGTTALAALGLGIPLVIVNFAISDMIAVGSSVPISIALGRGEEDKANNYFTCACISIVLTGIAMGAILFGVAPAFMRWMGASGALAEQGVSYIRIYAMFSPVTTMGFALDNYLRISGKNKVSMALNIASSLGTVLFEFILIFVLKWGIRGAALGACIPMSVTSLVGFCLFKDGKLQLKPVRPRFEWAMLASFVKNGLPAFMANVSGRIVSIVMNFMLLAKGGEAATAVYGVLMTVGATIEQVLYGVLDSQQPAIGYNFGAEKFERAKKLAGYGAVCAAVISLVGMTLILAIPKWLAIPFLEDLSLVPMAVRALRLYAATFAFQWFSRSVQKLFSALEKAGAAITIATSYTFVFPLVMIGALNSLGLDGLWLNSPTAALLTAILASALLLVRWKRLFVVPTEKQKGQEPADEESEGAEEKIGNC
ncbi:MAG: MATE family efflux transporter [Clostridia bacterium]|nr:MATE family efflux transporter [Clostridia bacterium]